MMKCLLLLSFFFLTSSSGKSQGGLYTITGKVTDKVTGMPLQAASVFAQNTTFGVVTNAEGNFSLRLPNGGYDLVVTFTGYETEIIRISNSSEDKALEIRVGRKEKAMEEVSIVATGEIKDGWQKYGQFFFDNFIGVTEFSRQTVIKNPEILKFYFSKKRNRLKVMAEEPLIIENNALGYNIRYSIDSFTYEYNTKISQFTGYPLFEEMPSTPEKAVIWKDNRYLAYSGSLLHFMRSFYNKTLAAEGYELQYGKKSNSIERAGILQDPYHELHYAKDDSTHSVSFGPNLADLVIIYNREEPEQAYLDMNNIKTKMEYQVSTLSFSPGELIVIEQNGYFYDQSAITINGYWGYEKVGDMLPYDYNNMLIK